MSPVTDWLMVVITAVYVATTIAIWISNRKSAKAAKEAVEESKSQFRVNLELQKQHNIDSVRPAVSIDFSSENGEDSYSGSICLTNHGLGPAIIKGLYFTRGDKVYKNTNNYCTIYDMLCYRVEEEHVDVPAKCFITYNYSKEFRNSEDSRDYLAVGEKLVLLKFEAKDKQKGEIIGNLFHNVHMELVYTDIFNSCDWTVRNRLSYFKPNWLDIRKVSRLVLPV